MYLFLDDGITGDFLLSKFLIDILIPFMQLENTVLSCLFIKHLRVHKYNVYSQKWYIKKLNRLFFSYKLPPFIYQFW